MEKNKGTTSRRHLAREFGSRYRSHFPSASSSARPSPSPNIRQPETTPTIPLSADRMQPITPPMNLVFESDISPHNSKGEKALLSQALPDHAFETKRTPLKGDNSADETENSRPVNMLNSQLLLNKATKLQLPHESSNDMLPFDKSDKTRSRPVSPMKPSLQSLSITENSRSLNNLHSQLLDRWPAGRTVRKVTSGTSDINVGLAKPLQKSPGDMLSEGVKGGFKFHSVDDNSVSIEKAISRPTAPYKASTASASSISNNSSSIDSLNSQLLDQYRWPSTTGEKTSSNSDNKSADLSERNNITTPLRGSRASSSRRLSLDGSTKLLLHESSSDMQSLLPLDDNPWSLQRVRTSVVSHETRPHPTSPSKPFAPFFSKVSPSGTKATAHFSGSVTPSSRRLSLDEGTNLLQNSSRDLKPRLQSDKGKKGGNVIPDSASRLISPSKPSSESRGVSPSRTNVIASATSLFWGLEPTSSRTLSLEGGTKLLQNSSREMLSLEGEKPGFGSHPIDLLPIRREKTSLVNPETRSHPTSPTRASTLSSSLHIGVIPSQAKTLVTGTSRRLPFEGATKTLPNSSGDMLSVIPNEHTESGLGIHSVDDNSPTLETERTKIVNPSTRSGVVNPSKAKVITNPTSLFLGSKVPPLRRLSLDGAAKPLQKSSNDMPSLLTSTDSEKGSVEIRSFDDSSLSLRREKTPLVNPSSKSRPTSPNKASALYLSLSRVTPSQAKAIPSAPPRRASPSKVRPSSPTRQTNSGFSFVADIRENDASQTEDAHHLRILHNRLLQWRYANAQANAAIHAEEVNTKEMAYNVWKTTSNLWGTMIELRIKLLQLRQELKLYSVLNKQLSCLDEWSSIESNHIASVLGASQDMKACLLRLPIMGGARGDTETLKSVVCSAFVAMQFVESSIRSMLSQLEGTSILVSKLAAIVAQERVMLDEFELLMSPTADMQVEEYSLRAHLMQLGTILQKR